MGPVHVRLYGRVDLLVNGRRCLVPAGSTLELLVLLTAWPGTVVIEGALVERLRTTAVALDNEVLRHVSALRRSVNELSPSIGDDWIQQVHGGYRTNPELVTSDLVVAEAMVDADLDDPPVMWWSAPLIGLPEEPFLHVRERLDTIALDLAARSLAPAAPPLGAIEVERLTELLSRHPGEQDLWARLVDVALATGDELTIASVRMEIDAMRAADLPVPAALVERLGDGTGT